MALEPKINPAARVHSLGDAAMTLEFGTTIDLATNARVAAAHRAIHAAAIPGVVEFVPTFRSLTIHFDPARIGFDALAGRITKLDLDAPAAAEAPRIWTVPVVYDGPDLEAVAEASGLTPEEVAALHSGTDYRVYMLGFLPGFAYLGDLPEPLRLPRLAEPRVRVPPGSVAIADQLTAIYPVQSPGGWRLIGRTPFRTFDPAADPPIVLRPHDVVRFTPVDAGEFERLTSEDGR